MYKIFVLPPAQLYLEVEGYLPAEGELQLQCGCTIAFMSVPLSQPLEAFQGPGCCLGFSDERSVKIDKCKARGRCPTEPDQRSSQNAPGRQILHTIKHVSDAQKDINPQPGFSTPGEHS